MNIFKRLKNLWDISYYEISKEGYSPPVINKNINNQKARFISPYNDKKIIERAQSIGDLIDRENNF